jgi:hypothetical protein
MAKLDYIEKDKISKLLNNSGCLLDFTNAKYQQFVQEKTGIDLYSKYGMSKGKNLEAIVAKESDSVVGKLLLELLQYMRYLGCVTDENRTLFNECVQIGNKLLGKKPKPPIISSAQPQTPIQLFDFQKYLNELIALSNKPDTPQARGYAFEKYLNDLFKASGLEPRGAFKIRGEQIDGSFILRDEVYLLEAKWTTQKTGKADLVVFKDKVSNKSTFTRGLFISYSGYTNESLESLSIGSQVNIILMTVQELVISLQHNITLDNILWEKVRSLAETGNFNKSVFEM